VGRKLINSYNQALNSALSAVPVPAHHPARLQAQEQVLLAVPVLLLPVPVSAYSEQRGRLYILSR
jgi:hypothetical protein